LLSGDERHLCLCFLGRPEVVGVEEGDVFSGGFADARVSRGGEAAVGLVDISDFIGVRFQPLGGVVG